MATATKLSATSTCQITFFHCRRIHCGTRSCLAPSTPSLTHLARCQKRMQQAKQISQVSLSDQDAKWLKLRKIRYIDQSGKERVIHPLVVDGRNGKLCKGRLEEEIAMVICKLN